MTVYLSICFAEVGADFVHEPSVQRRRAAVRWGEGGSFFSPGAHMQCLDPTVAAKRDVRHLPWYLQHWCSELFEHIDGGRFVCSPAK